MPIDPGQFREMINDALRYLEPEVPHTDRAAVLLMLTAATESHLGTYIRQVRGPALGVFQMEPATEEDIWANYLAFQPVLRKKVFGVVAHGLDNLRYNLFYQTAMARIHYRRVPSPLPSTVEGMAWYWKQYYNTGLGKGTIEGALAAYKKYGGVTT